MNSILIIPDDGKSFTIPSLKEATKKLKMSENKIRRIVEEGRPVTINGKKCYLDYELTLVIDKTMKPKMRDYSKTTRYELISQYDDRVLGFSSYVNMARYIGKGENYVRKNLKSGRILESKDGLFYTLRVLGED